MDNDDNISAFAFNTGKQIEALIRDETNNLKKRNQELEALVLGWYLRTNEKEFAKYFGITCDVFGKTKL